MSTLITFIGHSTVLLQKGSHTIITDPIFSDRVLFLKRRQPLPMKPEEMPEPTAVIISHAHYDHLDLHTLKYFRSSVPIVLPTGVGKLVSKFVKNPIIEISSQESTQLVDGLSVTTFPVTHTGFRLSGLTYRNCNGYLIDLAGTKIFFPGDTAYRSDFAKFKDQAPDVALLPIGPCAPEKMMRRWHLNPEDALRILEETGAKKMIPVHWGCFPFGPKSLEEPLTELQTLMAKRNLEDRVSILRPGEKIEI